MRPRQTNQAPSEFHRERPSRHVDHSPLLGVPLSTSSCVLSKGNYRRPILSNATSTVLSDLTLTILLDNQSAHTFLSPHLVGSLAGLFDLDLH